MKTKLEEILIDGIRVRERSGGDLADWLFGINSILCPSSVKCKAELGMGWTDCLATARKADDGTDRICITVTFSDATTIVFKDRRTGFLPEGYLEKAGMQDAKARKKARKKAS